MDRDQWTTVDCLVMRVTPAAVMVKISEETGAIWLPKSTLIDDGEGVEVDDEEIIVATWMAKQKGID